MAKRKDKKLNDEKENSLNTGKGNKNFDPYINKGKEEPAREKTMEHKPGEGGIRSSSEDKEHSEKGYSSKDKRQGSITEEHMKMPVATGDKKGSASVEGNITRESQKKKNQVGPNQAQSKRKNDKTGSPSGSPEQKSGRTAKVKEPAKITQASKGRFEEKSLDSNSEKGRKKSGKQSKPEASEEKINLPENPATSKDTAFMESTPGTPEGQSGKSKKTVSDSQSKSTEKISPGPEVKGSGKKAKEKKAESEDSTVTEDLKDIAMSTATRFAEKFLPDEETRNEITRTAMEILPDQNEIEKSIKKAKSKFSPEIEQVNKIVDKFISPWDIKETTGKIQATAKRIKNRSHEKDQEKTFKEMSLISDYDVHLFKEGRHFHLYNKFGSHLMEHNGTSGVYFAVWAPNAKNVSVIGDFNNWVKMANPMKSRPDESGIWEIFIPEAKKGSLYKYFIQSTSGYEAEKGDPFAFMWEVPPNTASVVWDLKSDWGDEKWLTQRKNNAGQAKPVSVYELHIGSWKRVPEDGNRSLTYKEMAVQLPAYLNKMGFTHVEFMPVMEHPFFGSWGYQVTGYFAPSSRFGNPQDFMSLIDALHQAGIGVILDWVPSHFPSDLHGLHYYDGTFLYEHEDPQKGFHPDWQSYIFNYGRNEVRSFLISNALFWLDKFHADGLRVDAVASMLYLDYSRKHGEWQPNEHGGNENLEAISFLKQFNEVVYSEFPDTMTIAEESTAWPMVSKPTYMGGLGFGMKWMMGWMHDTLEYFQKDPVHRKHHQDTITFSTNYVFTENFMLPLSHDEVVYGKKSLLNKMPGDQWNKFSNLRALYSYMFAHPGTKLLFMGAEFAQIEEWGHDTSLDWHLTGEGPHKEMQDTIAALNRIYTQEPAFYEKAFDPAGFEWVDFNDRDSSIMSFLRKGNDAKNTILVVCNLTPIPRENYRIGVPAEGAWKEIYNSDDRNFGGSNVKNAETIKSSAMPLHGQDNSVALTLPPMGVIYLKRL